MSIIIIDSIKKSILFVNFSQLKSCIYIFFILKNFIYVFNEIQSFLCLFLPPTSPMLAQHISHPNLMRTF